MQDKKPINIGVMAAFFDAGLMNAEHRWIDDFVNRPDMKFVKIPFRGLSKSWHNRGAVTPIKEWFAYFAYVFEALKSNSSVIVTTFPPLALVTGFLLRLPGKRNIKLIAWNFNLGSGTVTNKAKGKLAGWILNRASCFIVHARGEIDLYSKWLGLDPEKFIFIPLQRGAFSSVPPSRLVRNSNPLFSMAIW